MVVHVVGCQAWGHQCMGLPMHKWTKHFHCYSENMYMYHVHSNKTPVQWLVSDNFNSTACQNAPKTPMACTPTHMIYLYSTGNHVELCLQGSGNLRMCCGHEYCSDCTVSRRSFDILSGIRYEFALYLMWYVCFLRGVHIC